MVGDELIGREAEQKKIWKILARLTSGTGEATVVTGPPGIGKSALLRDSAQHARSGNVLGTDEIGVSYVVGSEAEREWPYSGLDLVLSTALGSLPPDQLGESATGVDELVGRIAETASSYEVARQVQALTSRVRSAIIILVDDAHRLDVPSQEVLGFVARRLRQVPVALVLAVSGPEHPAPFDGLPTIPLGELSPSEATEVIRRAEGPQPASSVARRIAAEVGGNPRALLDVIARVPDVQRLGQVELDRYLPLAPALVELHLPDLDDLDESQRFALLVATGSEDGRLAPVLHALSGYDDSLAAWLLGEHLNQTDGSFTLRRLAVRSIIWRAATHIERRRAHEALAAAHADIDPDQQLWHLAQVRHDYDDELAAGLERVSTESLARGEFERSLAFAREAARLTSGSEERIHRLLLTGEFALLAGRLDEAVHVARERFRLDTTVEQRADLALLEVRARNLLDGDVATGLITRHVAEIADIDPNRAARLNLFAAIGLAERMEQAEAARFLALAEQYSEDFDDATRSAYRRAAALHASVNGDLERAVELIEADASSLDASANAEIHIQHATVLLRAEVYDKARRLLQVITVDRRFGDSPLLLSAALSTMVVLEVRAGWLGAAREAASAWDSVATGGANRAVVPAYMIRAHALLGENTMAWEERRRSLERARRHGDWWATALAQSETGTVLLLQGRFDEAISVLEHARRYALEYADPSILAVEPDYVEACFRSGEYGRAKAALADLEERASRVPTAWARHTLARCRALVADGESALSLFQEAVETAADRVSLVELSRTMICFGERLRRLGRRTDARMWLHRATVLAQECGAVAIVVKAGEELSAAGGPKPAGARFGDLTEAELRIATLVAAGKRNREIAAELFVSVRTVEAHLGRIFRKLGVRSRTELTGIMVAGGDEPDDQEP